MRKSRFTESQILAVLKEGEAGKVAELVRKHGISRQPYFKWKSKYVGATAASTPASDRLSIPRARFEHSDSSGSDLSGNGRLAGRR
jgi:putative transposase